MRTINMCAWIGLVVLAGAVQAAEPTVSAIRAGRLVDVVNGKVLGNQVIVVRDGKIDAVSSADSISIPSGAKVIDLSTIRTPGATSRSTRATGR